MEDFDIQISMNGVKNELNANLYRYKKNDSSSFDGEEIDSTKEEKKSWTDTLNNLTN